MYLYNSPESNTVCISTPASHFNPGPFDWGYSRPLCRLDVSVGLKLVDIHQVKPTDRLSPNLQDVFTSKGSRAH